MQTANGQAGRGSKVNQIIETTFEAVSPRYRATRKLARFELQEAWNRFNRIMPGEFANYDAFKAYTTSYGLRDYCYRKNSTEKPAQCEISAAEQMNNTPAVDEPTRSAASDTDDAGKLILAAISETNQLMRELVALWKGDTHEKQ